MTEENTAPEVLIEAVKEAPKTRLRRPGEVAPVVEAAPKTAKYEVINGAIAPYGGGCRDLTPIGTIIELSADLAKHYNKLGYLKPYIED